MERLLGLGAVALALPVIAASYSYGIGTPKSPGAGFWPLVIAVILAVLGVLLVLRRPPAETEYPLGKSRPGKLAAAIGSLLFYVFALEPLGYLLATAILLFVQLRYVEGRTGRLSAATAILAALLSFLLFRVLLKVMLPSGVIPLPRGW